MSDHKAVIMTLFSNQSFTQRSGRPVSPSFWKLNSRILDDRDFHANFLKIFNESCLRESVYDDCVDWYDSEFKISIQNFLKDFSAQRQKSRRDTKSLLFYYLQLSSQNGDWETVSYCRSRLKNMYG